MKNNIMAFLKIISYILILLLPTFRLAHAQLDSTITDEEKAQYDQILTPIGKIYKFVKYAASLLGAIALVFAGASYMFSGNDVRRRDTSKNMAMFTLIGLSIIWAAPFVVNLLNS